MMIADCGLRIEGSVCELKGAGPKTCQLLKKLNITTIKDLLFNLPFRYQNRTYLTPSNKLRIGSFALIEGKIIKVESYQSRTKNLICHIEDGSGVVVMHLLHFSPKQKQLLLRSNLTVRCYGEIRWGKFGLEMIHPEYKIISPQKPEPLDCSLTPVYSATAGLSQYMLRKLTAQSLQLLANNPLKDLLPENISGQFGFADINAAISFLHQPDVSVDNSLLENFQHLAQQRLIFEELLAQQLSLLQLRRQMHENIAPILPDNSLLNKLLASLPFSLTAAQQRVINEISQDLMQNKPMLRLLQGDVGSGKTIVAVAALLQATASGFQAAIMAPTEILAEQHYRNFSYWLKQFNINIAWLSGKTIGKKRDAVLETMQNGSAKIIVGTHALFQEKVNFNNLALIIIDEQHRFGVHQRLALREKGVVNNICPHQLIMTATPIPRTITMLAYADLDCSIIDELPKGRKPVTTITVASSRRQEVLQRVQAICKEGRQVYWVCPLIEESEKLQCQAAETTAKSLSEMFPELVIGLIHGRMKAEQKKEIMDKFNQNRINLLVATTVIEVGVDVANASLMIIENAERLGLAQLHQLRGRVGRGNFASHCVLLYQYPLSNEAKERLAIMRQTNDGFKIAEKDLELRGGGELLGTKQAGLLQLKIANISRDQYLLPKIQQAAKQMILENSQFIEPLIERWVGRREIYLNA